MNFHVIVVHFPVALLSLYSVAELIRFRRIMALPYWFYLKGALVIVGALAAVAARQTGELIRSQYEFVRTLVETHEMFANITIAIYLFIALLYAVAWLKRDGLYEKFAPTRDPEKGFGLAWHTYVVATAEILLRGWVILFALAGLASVTITGALGGSISRGPQTDPIANFVYNLLNLES